MTTRRQSASPRRDIARTLSGEAVIGECGGLPPPFLAEACFGVRSRSPPVSTTQLPSNHVVRTSLWRISHSAFT